MLGCVLGSQMGIPIWQWLSGIAGLYGVEGFGKNVANVWPSSEGSVEYTASVASHQMCAPTWLSANSYGCVAM